MDIIFLGTSSGTPTKTRNVTAIAIIESQGSDWYLIDCGEGTQHRLLYTRLSLNALKAIFITHIHGDHCYGLPGVLASAGMNGRTKPLTIVAPKGIKEWFESTQTYTQLYLPYELTFAETEHFSEQAFGQFSVSSTKLSHRVPSFAYSFIELNVDASLDIERLKAFGVPQGPMWGKLKSGVDVEHQGQILRSSEFIRYVNKPRKVVVCGDNDTPELLRAECVSCDVLVHESTYTEALASKAREAGHSYAKLVASFAQSCALPNLLLTHFSPRYQLESEAGTSVNDIKKEAQAEYTGTLFLASDLETYRLNKLGELSLVSEV